MSEKFDAAFAAYEQRRAAAQNRGLIDGAPWVIRTIVKGAFIGIGAAGVVAIYLVGEGIWQMWAS